MKKETQLEMGFLEHLEELRWRLVRSLFAILILIVIEIPIRKDK